MTRPRLSVDVGPLFDDEWTGIPVFTKRLIVALLRHGGIDVNFISDLCPVPTELVIAALRTGNGTSLREACSNQRRLARFKIDRDRPILYPTVKKKCGAVKREASVIHDLSTLHMPETHQSANVDHHLSHLQEEIASDVVVFCTSEATRAAVSTAFPSAAHRSRVLYQYVEWPEEFAAWDRNLPDLQFGRYAVVVGTIEPRKNLSLLFDALSEPTIAKSQLKFVVIGRRGWLVDELLGKITASQRKRLIFTGFVSEFTKYRLLQHCEFLVYPSLYEGFGIPALEAMSLGKPVLASRSSSFPEIVEDAGIYFDPLSAQSFAAAVREIQHFKIQSVLGRHAIRQGAKFDARRMVQSVMDWAGA